MYQRGMMDGLSGVKQYAPRSTRQELGWNTARTSCARLWTAELRSAGRARRPPPH